MDYVHLVLRRSCIEMSSRIPILHKMSAIGLMCACERRIYLEGIQTDVLAICVSYLERSKTLVLRFDKSSGWGGGRLEENWDRTYRSVR